MVDQVTTNPEPTIDMNKHSIRLFYVMAIFFCAAPWSHADEADTLQLSRPISALVTKVMNIKTEAMKLPAMRSEEGLLGKQIEAIMDQIADQADEDLVQQAELTQPHDIRAKIILWAQDRNKRPAEYARFAKWYLNRPLGDREVVEYFHRPWCDVRYLHSQKPTPESYIPRLGTWKPYPVDKGDAIDANRLLMEYCFFMPPTGEAFDNENARYNFMIAIIALGSNDDSYVVFKQDADIYFEGFKNIKDSSDQKFKRAFDINLSGLTALMLMPCVSSFESYARYCSIPSMRLKIVKGFEYLKIAPRQGIETGKTIYDNLYKEWMRLVKQDWHNPDQIEFARILTEFMKPPIENPSGFWGP